ncbi:MAG: hypothetical protein HYY33_05705 [Chloroflexi bacterium]|nr:hypothetical protein [Chloroflexota bacterium]
MNNHHYRSGPPTTKAFWVASRAALKLWKDMRTRRGLIVGLILVGALAAFESFNFSTTEFALADMLGDLRFSGLRWATILAIAFCGIDFAGLARLFTPDRGRTAAYSMETWYLLGAWFLGATMNAMMTWWAVSLAMMSHEFGNEILGREQLLAYVPVFVAALVWLTRILIIGTFSVAGERLFAQAEAALLEVRNTAATPRPPAYAPQRVAAVAPAQPLAKVIGGSGPDPAYIDADDDPFVERPAAPRRVTMPAPAPAYRPAAPMAASATRPAPKPSAYQPAPVRPENRERPERV